ncbi:MAG: hypothetical protein AVDCRST_MAG33-1453 [uncultured Thermomicrobiales bacterium]|uniref:Uncharacterized protein n=1 Tax=uncultured Thermomicrobiales bacterium TaxID=1645740 RepID=A0A6J4UWR0_9BACT|nr:MAG: hypothetical protein AVDCRST_MAG33-1453 [uncultured Thermomicrobiales bacterium]
MPGRPGPVRAIRPNGQVVFSVGYGGADGNGMAPGGSDRGGQPHPVAA